MAQQDDGGLTFRRPDGRSIPYVPDSPVLSFDPMDLLRDVNIALGVRAGSDSLTPDWRGEHLDVGYAIDVLHPLALAARPELN